MQRAYDQVIHDVAIQNLPVVFFSTVPDWWDAMVPLTMGPTTWHSSDAYLA